MRLGIDFGTSMTDFVLLKNKKVILSGSLESNDINLILNKVNNVDKIFLTGGRAPKINRIKDIPVKKVNEIGSIGRGGCFVSNEKNALIVSIGSGTAMVSVKGNKIKHIGGTPVGSRTLKGLGKLLINNDSLNKIEDYAKKGDLEKTDITLKSIYPKGIGLLPPSATASHFGNVNNPRKEDISKALINMVAQTIGTLAVFGAQANNHKKIILTGKITQSKSFKEVIKKRINTISKIPVIIPKKAAIATAIGAALSKD